MTVEEVVRKFKDLDLAGYDKLTVYLKEAEGSNRRVEEVKIIYGDNDYPLYIQVG